MSNLKSTRRGDEGISLIEVLIAVSLLGISFAAVFSGLSTALRTASLLHEYDRSLDDATKELNELVLDPRLAPGEERFGNFDSGARWRAATTLVESRPGANPDRPVELIHIRLETSWATPLGRRSFVLQTLKLRIPQLAPNPQPGTASGGL